MLCRFRPIILAILLLLTPLSAAQAPSTQPSADLTIYLMTIGPGKPVYEWFGHNAIVVVDHRKGESYAFNYGVFEFTSDFLPKFIEGKMMYWMEAYYLDNALQEYQKDNRTIWMQELNLSERQKVRLYSILGQQLRQKYLYNYYTANCSTKVRDALDVALDGQLKPQLEKIQTNTTYRSHSQRLAAGHLPIYTSLYYILGHAVDVPLNAWEESFLPVQFMNHLKSVTIRDGNSPPVPIIKTEELKYRSTAPPERAQPPNWIPHFLIAGTLFGGLLILLTRTSLKTNLPLPPGEGRGEGVSPKPLRPNTSQPRSSIFDLRSSLRRYLLALLLFLWSLLAAFAGSFLSWAFTTDHWSVYWNENILQMTPLSVPLIVLAPAAALGRRWALRPALFFSFAALLASVLGLILQLLPGFFQVNGPIIALCLPIHLSLALSMYMLSRRNPPPADASAPTPAPKPGLQGAAMRLIVSTILLILLAGCANGNGNGRSSKKDQPPVPPPPPRVNVPLDEHLRNAAREQIASAFASDDPIIRTHAVEAAREALGSAARNMILKALEDKQGIVRYAAAMATGELRLEVAKPLLLRMINDTDTNAQIGAIFALHRLGDYRYSIGLENALNSPDHNVRATAAFALGRLGDKSAIKILRKALKDRAVEVRLQAAEALWRLGDEEGLKALVAASLSGHPAHAMVGLLGLAGPGDTRVREHVRAGLESDYTEVKLVAARALGLLSSDEAYILAQSSTRSNDARQRSLAALALGAIARSDSQETLAPLLKDPDPDVRVAAATAILQLRP